MKSEAVNLSGPTQQFFQLKKPPKKSMLAKNPNLDFGVPGFCNAHFEPVRNCPKK